MTPDQLNQLDDLLGMFHALIATEYAETIEETNSFDLAENISNQCDEELRCIDWVRQYVQSKKTTCAP